MFSQVCLALFLSRLDSLNHNPLVLPKNLVLGHRGARSQAPENTLAAFEKAMQLGAHGIEFDVYLSADKVPFVIHDDTLERTTHGKGVAYQMPIAELAKIEATKGWPSCANTTIPTLEQTLSAMPEHAVVNIEMKGEGLYTKSEFADSVFEVMAGHKHRLTLIVSSFDFRLLEIMRNKDPGLLIGFLLDEHGLQYIRSLSYLKKVKPNALHISPRLAKPWIVERAHRKGLFVLAWTVNDPSKAAQLRASGVDGLFSDMPPDFVKTLAVDRGMKLC